MFDSQLESISEWAQYGGGRWGDTTLVDVIDLLYLGRDVAGTDGRVQVRYNDEPLRAVPAVGTWPMKTYPLENNPLSCLCFGGSMWDGKPIVDTSGRFNPVMLAGLDAHAMMSIDIDVQRGLAMLTVEDRYTEPYRAYSPIRGDALYTLATALLMAREDESMLDRMKAMVHRLTIWLPPVGAMDYNELYQWINVYDSEFLPLLSPEEGEIVRAARAAEFA